MLGSLLGGHRFAQYCEIQVSKKRVCWGREKIMGAGKVSPIFSQSASALVLAEGLQYPQVRVQQAVQSAQGVLAGTHDGFGAPLGGSGWLADLGNWGFWVWSGY
jgi:hypothetical protein